MRILTLFAVAALTISCGVSSGNRAEYDEGSAHDALTSATGIERTIQWDGYVYVPEGTDRNILETTVARQIKSAIGALRTREIALQSRDARPRLKPSTWATETLWVIDTEHASTPPRKIERVHYHYADTAMVREQSTTTTFKLPLMFGDYGARSGEIIPPCSDDLEAKPEVLWFHFNPTLGGCQTARYNEANAVRAAADRLEDPTRQTSLAEVNRLYIEVRAELTPVPAPGTTYPEYDRLWGFGTDRSKLVIYAFFGVDAEDHSPTDASFLQYLRFLRHLRAAFPQYRITFTSPPDTPLDFSLDGVHIAATHEDTFTWIIDRAGFPAAATSTAQRDRLAQQVASHYAERWIYWDLPVVVTRGTESREVTVELRTFWGFDEKPEYRSAARARYLEGLRNADVFLYQGHSHYGLGPLDPSRYSSNDFPTDRYQAMLFNSCISFNYYDTAYLALHPGGSRNLDIVVNGLTSHWSHLGDSTASFVLGLTDGKNRSWQDLLSTMTVDTTSPWPDPMRVVNGELDNEFTPQDGRIELLVRPRSP